MTLHAITQYLRYRRTAKTRHGVHSPFVYTFVEDVLQDRKRAFAATKPYNCAWLSRHYNILVSRIIAFYKYKEICFHPIVSAHCDMILVPGYDVAQWHTLLEMHAPFIKNETIVLLHAIHKDIEHTQAWQEVCSDPAVTLSIDLYGVGLLLFRKEFKVKQHFVLRY